MVINLLLSSLPIILTGVVMIYFSDEISSFIRDTRSTSLIRGLDNPWTFKALGWALVVFGPVYAAISLYLASLGL